MIKGRKFIKVFLRNLMMYHLLALLMFGSYILKLYLLDQGFDVGEKFFSLIGWYGFIWFFAIFAAFIELRVDYKKKRHISGVTRNEALVAGALMFGAVFFTLYFAYN